MAEEEQKKEDTNIQQISNNEIVIKNINFKDIDNYQLSLIVIKDSGQLKFTLQNEDDMFCSWQIEINFYDELSKQNDLKDLCGDLSLAEFQHALVDLISQNQYTIEIQQDESVLLSFFDMVLTKKLGKQIEVKKVFQFQLAKKNLLQGNFDEKVIEFVQSLQERILLIENKCRKQQQQLDNMYKYFNTDAQELEELSKNPLYTFQNISTLLNTPQLRKSMQQLLPINYQKLKPLRLYLASQNKFSVQSFHEKTDNKGPLLFVLQTVDGELIGGFCPDDDPFSPPHGKYKVTKILEKDQGPFIFNLSKQVKCPLTKGKQDSAYYACQSYGPTMGSGNDLKIMGNKTFSLNIGGTYDSNDTNFVGQSNYVDYEVFGFY